MNLVMSLPWGTFRTADGTAEEIPHAVLGLAGCADADEARKHYWSLDNHIVRQGTVYEAAYYAIPFIVGILRDGRDLPRGLAYDLLIQIAVGWASADAPAAIRCDDGVDRVLMEACRMRIREAIPFCMADLRDITSPARSSAVDLLGEMTVESADHQSVLEFLRELPISDDPKFEVDRQDWIRDFESCLR